MPGAEDGYDSSSKVAATRSGDNHTYTYEVTLEAGGKYVLGSA